MKKQIKDITITAKPYFNNSIKQNRMHKQPVNLTEYAKSIYEANKAKGFWDEKRSQLELLVLVQSELFEAFEAVRKDKVHVDELQILNNLTKNVDKKFPKLNADNFKQRFVENVKDTLQDEIADTIIRLLDFAGSRDMKLYDPRQDEKTPVDYKDAKVGFRQITFIVANMSNAIGALYDRHIGYVETTDLIFYLVAFAEHNEIDIWLHIELKLFYNSLRAYKHGKKF